MAKSPTVQGDSILTQNGFPYTVISGPIDIDTSEATGVHQCPVAQDSYLARVDLAVTETPTSALALLNIGSSSDGDAFVADYSLNGKAIGVHSLVDGDFTERLIPAGTILVFSVEAATAVGALGVQALLIPATSPETGLV